MREDDRDARKRKTQHWRDKLPPGDLPAAMAVAKANETSFFRLLKPSWWQLKKAMETRYDFSRHAIHPLFSHVLAELEAEYAAVDAREEARQTAHSEFGADPAELLQKVAPLQSADGGLPAVAALRGLLIASDEGAAVVERLECAGAEIP